MSSLKETDLYPHIKTFFEKRGYQVKSEVKNCDVICILKSEIIAIELKKSFTLKLLYQALDRKPLADLVFVAIPRPKNFRKKEIKHMLKILKALEIGLITVSPESPITPVQIIYTPEKNKISEKKKLSTLEKLNKKTDFNKGGSTSKDLIITLYRENSIQIACFLNHLKKASPKELKTLGCTKTTGEILRANYYNWFKKISHGVYKLSKEGENMLKDNKYKKVIKYYEREIKNVKL